MQKSFKLKNYTADGPPKDRGRSADHRFNLQASDTPMGCLLSKSWTVRQWSADGPPLVRRIYHRQFQSAVRSNFSDADGPLRGSRTVRSCAEQWGQLELTYIEGSLSFSPTNPHQTSKSSLSLSLSSTWWRLQGQGFLAWFPDGPSTSPDSSQDSTSCPLGIPLIPLIIIVDFTMKEARVWGAPIYFLAMDSCK